MGKTPLLQVSGLECVRGDRLLFSSLSFQLDSGELLHIQGANGCGKTSLLRILCGLSSPERGTILWHGQPVQKQRCDFLRDLLYLGHQPGIQEDLTPLENLRLVTHLYRTRRGANPRQILAHAGLDRHLDAPARALSAGQRQRIALARLLLQEATLWILDEPFTSLDGNGVTWAYSLLDRHLRRGGTVVLTSHQQVNTACPVRSLQLGG